MAKTPKQQYLNPAEYTILIFGGVSRVGRLINLNRSSVSKWKKYEAVPRQHHKALLEIAKRKRISLNAQDLILGRTISK